MHLPGTVVEHVVENDPLANLYTRPCPARPILDSTAAQLGIHSALDKSRRAFGHKVSEGRFFERQQAAAGSDTHARVATACRDELQTGCVILDIAERPAAFSDSSSRIPGVRVASSLHQQKPSLSTRIHGFQRAWGGAGWY